LLTCGNPVAPPFLSQTEPLYQEAGGLVSPFFFKDTSNPNAGAQAAFRDERTFFVQPSLTETVIDQWYDWAILQSPPAQNWLDPGVLNRVDVAAQVPVLVPGNPGDPVYSVFPMQSTFDWATDPATAISYGDVLIGKGGGIQAGNTSVARIAGSATGGVFSLPASGPAGQIATGGLTVVGGQGLSLTQF
jgi:hypothetical protein